MDIENKLQELGIVIPEINKPLAAYVPGRLAGDFIYVSGQLPIKAGEIIYAGRVGAELNLAEGQEAARLAAINCLAVLHDTLQDWSRLVQIVKITGYVQSGQDFYEQAKVINGASELLEQVFGERGKHARAALGVAALPLNAACEVEMIAQIRV
ncbi:putative aminoacrylate peracid reductase RutC [Sporotomaculum syntrophicum]|uniref:Aminoacrylate peracid reductase RutC n=1 Tax=Sporotomaculum syntrophicum TaxID=182264 RepID=A0A9D2WP74_9FIRM|nr:RidA family protein [Sporotomaculum syntrophicum]KAF1084396.1 putative aminoacrylate peracid reductase RutC [Sporotomaculum syntrophicum]